MIVKLHNMRVVSVSNANEHWGTTRARNKRQTFELSLHNLSSVGLPVEVTFYRIAPRKLDDDNLVSAFKHLRDCVASKLLPLSQANQHGRRGDDSDPRIVWSYGQRKGEPKEYGVEIHFTEGKHETEKQGGNLPIQRDGTSERS